MAPALLAPVDLRGCVVTGDAHFAHRALCHTIVAQGADYLFALKGNQPTLLEDVAYLFAEPPQVFPETTQRGRHGDRWEVRRLRASDALNAYSGWPHLGQVCRLDRAITRKGLTRWEVVYLITSLPPQRATPRRLLELARGHWHIENRLHYVRDVTLGEDASQVRCGAAPQVMAALRNTTIGLMRLAGTANIAAALRRHSAHPTEALALLGLHL